MYKPLISILVPVYGVEEYIEQCVRSLFSQTYDNIEFIFVDDCTKDRSIEILNSLILEYPERKDKVKVIRHSVNKGLAATRNTAIPDAQGEYILFVDSDDSLESNSIENLVKASCDGSADMVVGGVKYSYGEKIVESGIPAYQFNSNLEYMDAILYRKVPVNIWGKLIRRDILEHSDARFIEGLNYGEDYVTLPRLVFYANKISYITGESVYIYNRTNITSYTANGMTPKAMENLKETMVIFERFLKNKALDTKDRLYNLKVVNKIYLLKYSSDGQVRKLNNVLATNIKKCTIPLRVSDKLIWWLSERKWYHCLKLLKTIGFAISNIRK